MNRRDIIIAAVITILYAFVAFCRLGDFNAPQNGAVLDGDITLTLDRPVKISEFGFFNGETKITTDNFYMLFVPPDDGKKAQIKLNDGETFAWRFINTENFEAEKLIITADNLNIRELFIKDSEGRLVTPQISVDIEALFDEQELVPARSSFINSTYFDEVYYVRTAYEYIHGLEIFEWTHPPLGKLIMAVGTLIFGFTPFGWRFMGTLFGAVMIPMIYAFAKKMFTKTTIATLAAILLSAEFMHFSQTRIATIDSFLVLFILGSYLGMYLWASEHRSSGPLLISGIFMGCAIAVKWSGFYSAAGLAVIWIVSLYLARKKFTDTYKKYSLHIFGKSIIFFAVIPFIIYLLSYIPYINAVGGGIGSVIQNQKDIFAFHTSELADSANNAYASMWYEWPIIKRPFLYTYSINENGLHEGISAFINPIVGWGGLLALIFVAIRALKDEETSAKVLIVGYFAQLLPWVPVVRSSFIYHYFPCVPFLVLMLCYCVNFITDKNRKAGNILAVALAAGAVLVFALYYPVLSGSGVTKEYAQMLRLMPSWDLI